MSISLYDVSVTNYLQVLGGVEGFLDKGKTYCQENDIDLGEVVETRLYPDMNPFRFQVISVAHHSMGSIKGVEAGQFSPPSGYGEPDYAGLQNLVSEAKAAVESFGRDTVRGFEGGEMIFNLSANKLPFTAEDFVMSFSLPNLFFHATTAYGVQHKNEIRKILWQIAGMDRNKRHKLSFLASISSRPSFWFA